MLENYNCHPTQSCFLLASGLNVNAVRRILNQVVWTPFLHPNIVAMGERYVIDQMLLNALPPDQAQALLLACLRTVGGFVGKPFSATISANRLRPGQEVARHRDLDHGEDTRRWPLRHHLVVDAAPGCTFTIGNETIEHRTGQLWRVDRTRELHHSAKNNSGRDRVVITFNVPFYRPALRPDEQSADRRRIVA